MSLFSKILGRTILVDENEFYDIVGTDFNDDPFQNFIKKYKLKGKSQNKHSDNIVFENQYLHFIYHPNIYPKKIDFVTLKTSSLIKLPFNLNPKDNLVSVISKMGNPRSNIMLTIMSLFILMKVKFIWNLNFQ
jgi:hypothetical protein